MKIRTRIAPAPTGLLHLGTAHTALFNYLFAKHHRGEFVLRIDDSDPKRSQPEFETNIIEGLKWLGIKWDEGPDIGGPYSFYRQSERISVYQPYLQKLLREGRAYECFCSPEELAKEREEMHRQKHPQLYSGKCRNLTKQQIKENHQAGKKSAIRLRVNSQTISFTDPTRGMVNVEADTIGDFVLARNDGSPLLVFTTTIDDLEMKITHTIRGEDFLNLVPKQILLYQALREKPPIFAHLQFIYGPDGSKLSKRHGAKSVLEYRDEGYLPEALVNFLAYLGWSYQDNSQILSLHQLVKLFTLEGTRTGKPIFDLEKLKWLNGLYIRTLSDEDLLNRLEPFFPPQAKKEIISRMLPLIRERLHQLTEVGDYTDFMFRGPEPDISLIQQQSKHDQKPIQEKILQLIKVTEAIPESEFKLAALESAYRKLLDNDWNPKQLFMTLRVIITGKTVSPPLLETMEILGKKLSLQRLNHASTKLHQS